MEATRMSCSRILFASMLMAASGCSMFGAKSEPTKVTMTPDAFYRSVPAAEDPRQTSVDNAGLIPTHGVPGEIQNPQPPTAQGVTSIAPAVKETVQPSGASSTNLPSTLPSSAGGTSGQYMTVGAVVTQVSGTPIYADKVIQQLTPLLSSEAKQRDIESYRALASREVERQVNAMIRNELEYASAQQNLAGDDKKLADQLTTVWRQRQITDAGGSLEMARRKAAADGIDFDEKVREQNRTYLVQIFYQKKVFPKVQVTADDMRRYYDQHLSTEFSESDQAQFRLIRIDVKKMGGRDQAIDKIKDLHEKAARGDDFAKLASGINSDPNLMKTGGRVGGTDGWVQRGAFAIPEVEAAVWKLQPGQVTDVIQVGDSFYIAKLEDRKLGRVRPFEDEDVQKQIRDTLQRQQIAERREQVQAQLMKEAVIYPYPPELEPAIEIAMQKYPQWSTATK
jgi:parvulin-like peptidyl-prolyl isomerase